MTRAAWLISTVGFCVIWTVACADDGQVPGAAAVDAGTTRSGSTGGGDADAAVEADAGLGPELARDLGMELLGPSGMPDSPREFLAGAGNGWQVLVEGAWQLAANSEGWTCVRFTLPQELFVHALWAESPPGTHHTLLTFGESRGEPDGTSDCSGETLQAGGLFGSAIARAQGFELPDGVAVRLPAGQQLLLNLHVYNTRSEPLAGVSGTLIQTMPPDQVEHTAEIVIAGPHTLDIPVGGPSVQTGQCTMDRASTLLAIAPHMHQLGVHFRATVERRDARVPGALLIDRPYEFTDQRMYALEPLALQYGDHVRVECTYDNTTDAEVHYGQSSDAEMCSAALYRYPAGGVVICSH